MKSIMYFIVYMIYVFSSVDKPTDILLIAFLICSHVLIRVCAGLDLFSKCINKQALFIMQQLTR